MKSTDLNHGLRGIVAALLVMCGSVCAQDAAIAVSPAEQIAQSGFLPEPLRWAGDHAPGDNESRELLEILSHSDRPDFTSSLEQFVGRHERSAWAPSIRLLLANVSRNHGRHSLALSYWKATWDELKDSQNADAMAIANHALAGQLELLSSLGRVETIHDLLKAAEGRVITDHNDQRRIETARDAYLIMIDHPAISYRCGSLALANIARLQNKAPAIIASLIEEPSTAKGISLKRLVELSRKSGLGLVAVKRNDRLPLPVPAVVHWTQNHYGAILEYRPDIDSYRVVDPTFGDPKWIAADVLNAEASGYFLVPQDERPPSWRLVSDEECANVYGRGYPYNINDARDKGCKKDPSNPNAKCSKCGGMAVWWVTEPYINAWIADEPWSYTSSRGEQFDFRITVKQRGSITNSYGYPLPGLSHNWYSKLYIRGMPTSVSPDQAFSDWTATQYLGTGGERYFSKNSLSDEESRAQLRPTHGTPPDGYQYAVPGYTLATVPGFATAAVIRDNLTTGFRVFYPDGSIDRYGLIYWRTNVSAGYYECEALLTQHSDPLGNNTSLIYECYANCADSQQSQRLYRLKQVVDYDSKVTTFSYFTSNPERLQQVTSPYGQTATFGYDGQGRLSTITDAVQLISTLGWDSQGRVQTLVTPYGTNSFYYYEVPTPDPQPNQGNYGGHDRINRAITAVDANGGTNLYVYRFDSTNSLPTQFAASDIPNGTPLGTLDTGTNTATTNFKAVSFRNSFYWNPRQYATLSTTVPTNLIAGDYVKAQMQHWLGDSNNMAVLDLISVVREASPDGVTEGQKTFYDYPGKTTNYIQGTSSQIAVIARRQPSGSSEYIWSRYNSSGFLTNQVSNYVLADGVERTRTNIFVYASNTTTFTIQNQMQFNPNGNNWIVLSEPGQFFGDYEPWTGLFGAWTLSGTPTSSLSFENLLVAVTNAAGDSVHYGGFPQRTQTTTKNYWAWYTYDCNFGWCHADFSQTSTKTFTVPLPTAITNEAGYITTLFYDSNNRLIGIRGPSGLTTTNRYDSSGFLTNTVAIEISATNNFTYTNGLVFTHKGPLGLITTNLWDKLQRLQASYDSEGYISNVYTRLDLTAIKDKLGNRS